MGKRAQRIPSWPGVIHSNKGRIHLRRPTCDILTFRLWRSGGPYIPVSPSPTNNRKFETLTDEPWTVIRVSKARQMREENKCVSARRLMERFPPRSPHEI